MIRHHQIYGWLLLVTTIPPDRDELRYPLSSAIHSRSTWIHTVHEFVQYMNSRSTSYTSKAPASISKILQCCVHVCACVCVCVPQAFYLRSPSFPCHVNATWHEFEWCGVPVLITMIRHHQIYGWLPLVTTIPPDRDEVHAVLQLIHEVHEFTQYMNSRSTWICAVHAYISACLHHVVISCQCG